GWLDVFYQGSDGALHQMWNTGSGWSSPVGLGGSTAGTFSGAPAAASWGIGHVIVAVRGTDNALWVKTYADGTWSSWTSLGGALTSSPTIVSQGANILGIYYRGGGNSIYEVWNAGSGWSSPVNLGGNAVGAPTAVQ